ncbi:XRE family transcriptional regulator [Staphylococcus agnetis]|uniref:helix-turn-helix domain-containing protein n=1 Tax=Staphylococcus agnetis TaxID=985762 RepID=UPI00208E2E51|nr:XRE family transcriptional regulator [Staphylococcus agnetis]MCO4338086.1 XRE family transcriptional regulator [Staphylococcus agnetis]MCO4341501.1 XRE family transcriptional regulator [Staphylococcus agnetis]MCO4342565.1 XRE family transcriptional regulator [Staphylococcus agnetis]MCO4345828.1 XRE family transcriptional regulator [Staphylococcus agnetis]MCO4348563.1 XRE family transcriptional regulator [Staphylococcus agnetis]
MDIGQKLKTLRLLKNLTQEELGERTDLSKGYISQIESDKTSPSMETFLNLLEVLGTTPAEFFDKKQVDKIHYPKSEQLTYDEYDKGYFLQWPVKTSNDFEMEPLILTLQPHASYKLFEPSYSDTFVYCMHGSVTLKLGNEKYKASKGDALYFKATKQHQLINEHHSEGRVMIVATSSYL